MVGASPFAPSRPKKKVEKVISRVTRAGKNPLSKKSQRVVDAINTGINMGKHLFDRLKGKPKPSNHPYPSLQKAQEGVPGDGKQEVGVVVASMDGGPSREESLRSKNPVVQEHKYQPLKSNPITSSEVDFINATRAKALEDLQRTTNASGSSIVLNSSELFPPPLVIQLTSLAGLEPQEEVGTSDAEAAPARPAKHARNRVMADVVIDRTLEAFEQRRNARAKEQEI
ncbi:uncharacterized protein PAC_07763 [Phialocephala subalpina]|uniref:Uncharacterized protein n=1 Tax=Phialocephala subalpina TaxID=576137 RepID=A0A1L7WYM4_9HELO|nr:uncharacterized protein PAC_07763 [Phialocephala subalpina]